MNKIGLNDNYREIQICNYNQKTIMCVEKNEHNNELLQNKDNIINKLINTNNDIGQLGEIRNKLLKCFKDIQPDMVMVYGDVTSTISAALAAKELGIKIAHIESGLRSGDIGMPEEINRILTDHITDYYFVTEQSGVDNLKNEGLDNGHIYLVKIKVGCILRKL